MNPTEKNNINPNFSGVTTGGQYAQMNNPTPIAVNGLSEPVKHFQPPQTIPTDYSSVAQTASAVAQIPTQTSTPTDTTGFLKAIQETSSKLGIQSDVPSFVQQYKDLTGIDTAQLPVERQQAQAKVQELTAKLAMLDAKALKNQEDAMKRGETMGFASREAQNIARTDAIERLATSSELNAVQGRLDTAKQNVTDILNLQSKDLENKKQQQNTLFNNAKDIASADQQVALEKARQEASRKLAQENDFANLRQSLATELIKNGDIQGAMKVAKSNSMNELSLNAPSGFSRKNVSSPDLLAYASNYADTGKLPSPAELKLSGLSVGQVTEQAKQIPKPTGSLVSKITGIKSTSVSSAQEDGISALYDLTKKLDEAKTKFSNLSTGIFAGLGKTLVYTKAQQEYDTLKGEIVDLLARARSGAALTESEVKLYSNKLPGRFNQSLFLGGSGTTSIDGLKNSIEGKLNTNLNTNGLALYGYSKVKVNGVDRTVGEVLNIGGVQYKVLPDGTLTDII